MKKQKKLLVANRGEIACRVFQACRELGVETYAMMTAEDEQSRHVTYADQVIEVSSYLDIQSIVKAAKKAKIDMIHPGYGFLSERPDFVKAVEKSGITFIGPRAQTMELMGKKIAAKKLAEKNKVPTLPWAQISDVKKLAIAAKKIGYPLLLKASSGGGGKGMRHVNEESELLAAAESAAAEAQAAFGEASLFIEKKLISPRHIEVQVFGDGEGGGVHFFERECSLQRKHQKVWEEAPATNLSKKTKDKLFKYSLKLVKATRYKSAGTVEFLVNDKEEIFFLEMNTRLQVEHPVTEWITGADLVRAQIMQVIDSKSFKLKKTQEPRGHSIEVRLYAEDPFQGFIPTPGKVMELSWPTGPGIRVDSGIEKGQEVQISFDPMLAKLIVWGESRELALARLRYALDETVILGVGTNQAYLRMLCDHPSVIDAKVSTQFLENEFKYEDFLPSDNEMSLIVSASQLGIGKRKQDQLGSQQDIHSPWFEFGGLND